MKCKLAIVGALTWPFASPVAVLAQTASEPAAITGERDEAIAQARELANEGARLLEEGNAATALPLLAEALRYCR